MKIELSFLTHVPLFLQGSSSHGLISGWIAEKQKKKLYVRQKYCATFHYYLIMCGDTHRFRRWISFSQIFCFLLLSLYEVELCVLSSLEHGPYVEYMIRVWK